MNNAHGNLPWVGRTFDLKAAYKQFGGDQDQEVKFFDVQFYICRDPVQVVGIRLRC